MQGLAGPPEGERIYTISEITASVKDAVETRFPHVWVLGEISNCTLHSSGHAYFTLKDDLAQLSCVVFRAQRQHAIVPEDGLKVFAQGRLSVYERRGQHQMIVNTMVLVGKGDLQAAFDELKAKLQKEGLFDPSRKRGLPPFACRLGVVTSPTGAAVRDVIRMARKIYAGVEIVVRPVRVQGEGAAEEIVRAIGDLNVYGGVDVIILARGGGSIEDLWAFNEEAVARAIVSSALPVVSAVGHEVDFTIADFAADVRAPTPTAAPTIILADYVDVRAKLRAAWSRASQAVAGTIERRRSFVTGLATRYGLRRVRDRLLTSSRELDEAMLSAQRLLGQVIESRRAALGGAVGRIESLNPLATLRRGYSVCYKVDTGERVGSYKQIQPGDHVRMVFAEGKALCKVEKADKEIK